MKTTDFNVTLSSAQLNESMFKKFGTKINFDKYTREDLENYRNLLRTKINQTESSAGFNDLLTDSVYQKDKFVLELLNTKIKELLGEAAKSVKPGLPEKKTTKVKDTMKTTKTPAAKPKDAKVKENWDDMIKSVDDKREKEKTTGKFDKKKVSTGTVYTRKHTKADAAEVPEKKKAKIKEGTMRTHYRQILEGLNRMINEDEEGKAKDITAGSDMVNDFTSWMQRVGQYQTKSMIELADSIRANFGQAEADAFRAAITPALQEALSALTQSRETITRAVAVLAGEETAQNPMGMDPTGMDDGALDADLPVPDSMNTDDEFGASDAAAGGAETTGREMREGRQFARAAKLAEAHSIISKLAR